MKLKALPLIAVTALVFVAVSSSAWGETSPSASATQACASITEGASDNAATACAQGFADAGAHTTLAKSCALGVGAIELVENGHDCLLGFLYAEGVSETAPSPSAKAISECASITEGASDESPAACEQGYQDALAGNTQEASCDHLGAGAIAAPEYVISCEDGWFVAKGDATCLPGADPMNGEPGTTLAIDDEADKACVVSS
jgi:hypothetical protein